MFPSFSVINVHDKTIRTLVLNVRMAAMINHNVLVHSDLPEENPSTLDERLPDLRYVVALSTSFFWCFLFSKMRPLPFLVYFVALYSDLPEENPSTLDERLPGHRCVLALSTPFFHFFSSSKVLSLLFLVYFVVLYADLPEINPSTLDERLPGHRYVVALSTSFSLCFSSSKVLPLLFLVHFIRNTMPRANEKVSRRRKHWRNRCCAEFHGARTSAYSLNGVWHLLQQQRHAAPTTIHPDTARSTYA